MAVKVKDLAAMLNLSPATVSLVLNNRPGISEATRNRVRSAVRELGCEELLPEETEKKNIIFIVYRKHGVAQGSSPYFSQIFSEIIEGVESQVKARGYHLLVSYVDKDTVGEAAANIGKEQAQGVLVLATEMREEQLNVFAQMQVPVVIVDNYIEQEHFDCITINNEQGVGKAVRHLAAMGHRDIGNLHVADNANNFSERYYGFVRAMDALGADWSRKKIVNVCTDGGEAVYQTLKEELSAMEEMPTAFFADNDIVAIYAMRVFRELGYRIPEDVSIAGFDNIAFLEVLDPPLTSIQIPKHKMGIVAANTLIDRMNEPVEGVVKIEVETKLVVRGSVRDLRQNTDAGTTT